MDRLHDPNVHVDRLGVFDDGKIDERWIDERTQTTQESLIEDEEFREIAQDMNEGEDIDMDNLVIENEVSDIFEIKNQMNF
jgi:hypothetical protein